MQGLYPYNGGERYIITDNGKVFDCKTGKAAPVFLRNGYKTVRLYFNGNWKNYYLHRLLAEAFIPKEKGKEYVNHIDGDRLNDSLNNLEWVTCQENIQHGYDIGTHAPKGNAPRTAIECLETGEKFSSIYEWSKVYGMCTSSMYAHLSGESKVCAGKHWVKLKK